MTIYTQVFGGDTVSPSDVSLNALTITEDTQLYWPLDAQVGVPLVGRIMPITTDQANRKLLMPDATKEQSDTFNELQRRTTSPECAARYLETTSELDVMDLLPKISVPTLVMHASGDVQNPIEVGRQMAAGIPGAKFVALQGNNHILLEQDAATQRFFEEIRLFLAK